jgi:hypothetical protein
MLAGLHQWRPLSAIRNGGALLHQHPHALLEHPLRWSAFQRVARHALPDSAESASTSPVTRSMLPKMLKVETALPGLAGPGPPKVPTLTA